MSDSSTKRLPATRFDVESADGTPIAVWVDGGGPPLVLVHGCPTDHATFDPLVAELRSEFTTYAMDRRGSGASGDSLPYAIEREFEDVAAVVDAVSTHDASRVVLFAHSYGCNPAMGGAAMSANVGHLVLYEPSFGLTYPDGVIERIEEAVVAGDLEAAIRAVFVDLDLMTKDEFEALRAGPRWPAVVAAAPVLPRECRVENDWVYHPGQFDGVTVPTLFLQGSESPPDLVEATTRAVAAIPHAETRLLEGHAHFATRTDPALVAGIIREFVLRVKPS